MIVASRERVLRVAQLGTGEPGRAGHRVACENAFVAPARAYTEVLPDGGPEGVESGDRPAPQLLVIRERESAMAREPLQVARDVRAVDRFFAGAPDRLDGTIVRADSIGRCDSRSSRHSSTSTTG